MVRVRHDGPAGDARNERCFGMKTISVGKAVRMLSIWPLLVNTLAVLSTLIVAAARGEPAAVLAPLGPMAIILWRQRAPGSRRRRRGRRIGRGRAGRCVLRGGAMGQ